MKNYMNIMPFSCPSYILWELQCFLAQSVEYFEVKFVTCFVWCLYKS